jgi:hypothetical protein
MADPTFEGQAGGLGDLKPDRPARLVLHDRCPLFRVPSREDVSDPDAHQVAAPELAAGGQVEQRKVARGACDLEANPYGPDMPGQQRSLPTDDATLVPGAADRKEGRKKIIGDGSTSCPPGSPFFGHADSNGIPCSRLCVVAVGGKAVIRFGHRATTNGLPG